MASAIGGGAGGWDGGSVGVPAMHDLDSSITILGGGSAHMQRSGTAPEISHSRHMSGVSFDGSFDSPRDAVHSAELPPPPAALATEAAETHGNDDDSDTDAADEHDALGPLPAVSAAAASGVREDLVLVPAAAAAALSPQGLVSRSLPASRHLSRSSSLGSLLGARPSPSIYGGSPVFAASSAVSASFQPLPFESVFDAEGYLAEETPPDAEPLMAHVVKVSQSFRQFIEDRWMAQAALSSKASQSRPRLASSLSTASIVSKLGASGKTGQPTKARLSIDLFDKLAAERMALRSWRHLQLRSRSHSGQLWKSIRGTLCKSWERRLFELNGQVLAYYAHPDALEARGKIVTALKTQLSAVEPTRREDSGSSGASEEYRALAVELESAMSQLRAIRAAAYRRSFYLVPGRTEVVIPSTSAGTFPTPYLLQLVNPSLRELRARGVILQDDKLSLSLSGPRPRPAKAQLTPQELAGAGRDVLTLCADTSEERRAWILYLKARLRPADYAIQLQSLYADGSS